MDDSNILLEDDEKTVYELFHAPGKIPNWVSFTGDPAGWGCISGVDESGKFKMSDLYWGLWLPNSPQPRIFAVVPKQRIRPYETYSIIFWSTCVNGSICYAEEHNTIQLQEILNRFPDLYRVKELADMAKQYAVPALMMSQTDTDQWLKNTRSTVLERLIQKMQNSTVFGNLERLSAYQWTIGIENKQDRRVWVAFSLFWSKIKGNNDLLEQVIACQQDLMSGDINDRVTAILNKVLTPWFIKYKIDRAAEKTNTGDQLIVFKFWTAEKLTQLTTEIYKEIISEQLS